MEVWGALWSPVKSAYSARQGFLSFFAEAHQSRSLTFVVVISEVARCVSFSEGVPSASRRKLLCEKKLTNVREIDEK